MSQIVFIVEDEANISELVKCTLEAFDFITYVFESAEDMFETLKTTIPHVVILDIMLPGMDGIEALSQLHKNPDTADVKVIMLTAKSQEMDKVKCLNLGADDYVAKPFGVFELAARVKAVLRRNPSATASYEAEAEQVTLQDGLIIDTLKHEVLKNNSPVPLTPKEYDLFLTLYNHRKEVLSREQLLDMVWGIDFEGETRTLDVHIANLRHKLQDDSAEAKYIKTVRGVGYTFVN